MSSDCYSCEALLSIMSDSNGISSLSQIMLAQKLDLQFTKDSCEMKF